MNKYSALTKEQWLEGQVSNLKTRVDALQIAVGQLIELIYNIQADVVDHIHNEKHIGYQDIKPEEIRRNAPHS